MAIDPKFVGRSYGPFEFTAGLERMREFAAVIGGGRPGIGTLEVPSTVNPLLHDREAAKRGPYGAVIAFPTFAVTFAIAPFSAAITDPELGINVLRLVHGEQQFEWFEVIRDGDVLSTTGRIGELYSKAGMDFVVVETESKNQHGALVVRGTWTAVIRG